MGFTEFTRERRFLQNVSPRTLEWYENSFRWLPNESPTQEDLNEAVIRMRESGLSPAGCNCAIRAINSYLHWAHAGSMVKCSPACAHPKLPRLKEPEFVPAVYTEGQIRKFVSWSPKRKSLQRLRALVLTLIDTGCRIGEALALRVCDIDLDNLLVTLNGKGRKQRIVPFSTELRKVLFRYITALKLSADALLFATAEGKPLDRHVVARSIKLACAGFGFKAPARSLHAFRHTFATNYLRRGGSEFRLQKVLGHTTLDMTRRYASLVTADLQAVHERVSLLACCNR